MYDRLVQEDISGFHFQTKEIQVDKIISTLGSVYRSMYVSKQLKFKGHGQNSAAIHLYLI